MAPWCAARPRASMKSRLTRAMRRRGTSAISARFGGSESALMSSECEGWLTAATVQHAGRASTRVCAVASTTRRMRGSIPSMALAKPRYMPPDGMAKSGNTMANDGPLSIARQILPCFGWFVEGTARRMHAGSVARLLRARYAMDGDSPGRHQRRLLWRDLVQEQALPGHGERSLLLS